MKMILEERVDEKTTVTVERIFSSKLPRPERQRMFNKADHCLRNRVNALRKKMRRQPKSSDMVEAKEIFRTGGESIE